MKRLFCGLVALGLSLVVPAQARSQYVYTTLDVPGSTYTTASGINASGQIVGSYNAGLRRNWPIRR